MTITRTDAREIPRRRYDGPYKVYDGNPASLGSLLEPRFIYHSVYDGGDLVLLMRRAD